MTMTPPREYFELVIKPDWQRGFKTSPGEQRVGFDIYRFVDEFSLKKMLDDGLFQAHLPPPSCECDECLTKEGEIEDLKIDLAAANETIKQLRKELEDAKTKTP